MKYLLATYEILDGEHEHRGAVILQAQTPEEAYRKADAEEYEPETDTGQSYLSYCGDGLTACENRACTETSAAEMQFLERVGLAYRR